MTKVIYEPEVSPAHKNKRPGDPTIKYCVKRVVYNDTWDLISQVMLDSNLSRDEAFQRAVQRQQRQKEAEDQVNLTDEAG